jgi:hypothetical protein
MRLWLYQAGMLIGGYFDFAVSVYIVSGNNGNTTKKSAELLLHVFSEFLKQKKCSFKILPVSCLMLKIEVEGVDIIDLRSWIGIHAVIIKNKGGLRCTNFIELSRNIENVFSGNPFRRWEFC